jgi:formimidoylglutamate deiminase
MPFAPNASLFTPYALLPSGWAHNVLLAWNEQGQLTSVQVQAPKEARVGALHTELPVIPGMPNLHSHAFQRAFAGLTETRGAGQDSFWSWRTLMYRFASHLDPQSLQDVATWLYAEMLEAGYTSVCEFHYLHHQADGKPYADSADMSKALLAAAQITGMGLTLLPVLYQTAGFGAQPARAEQRRFLLETDAMLHLLAQLQTPCAAQGAALGWAPHSLRAVPPESLHHALQGLDRMNPLAPIHIHIAEQQAEVQACLQWSGLRPVQWLCENANLNARWCLVHATHMSTEEAERAAQSGAVAGLCPSTEANLGDGIFDVPRWQRASGAWGVGSDSHVLVDAAEELMLLEYSQRLALGERNVLTSAQHVDAATHLTLAAVAGGAQASARPIAGLAVGQKADFVLLDTQTAALTGLSRPEDMLSAHVFGASRTNCIAQVWVAGKAVVQEKRHALHEQALAGFARVRSNLAKAV